MPAALTGRKLLNLARLLLRRISNPQQALSFQNSDLHSFANRE